MNYCLEGGDILAGEGMKVEVVDLGSVYGLDKERIIDGGKDRGKVLVVTQHNLQPTIISQLSPIIPHHSFFHLHPPIIPLPPPHIPSIPFSPLLQNQIIINPQKILNKIPQLTQFYPPKL
ncbi:transketolase C-terminal domain-containing protein, partial [Staphylococcus aureus]|uniref:transketolase C-terminal domain-containing protein n=1 Tax=Staphylococcus aureus TaxID=1280 RepID=UPI0028CB926F